MSAIDCLAFLCQKAKAAGLNGDSPSVVTLLQCSFSCRRPEVLLKIPAFVATNTAGDSSVSVFCLHKNSWKTSRGLLENIQWCGNKQVTWTWSKQIDLALVLRRAQIWPYPWFAETFASNILSWRLGWLALETKTIFARFSMNIVIWKKKIETLQLHVFRKPQNWSTTETFTRKTDCQEPQTPMIQNCHRWHHHYTKALRRATTKNGIVLILRCFHAHILSMLASCESS